MHKLGLHTPRAQRELSISLFYFVYHSNCKIAKQFFFLSIFPFICPLFLFAICMCLCMCTDYHELGSLFVTEWSDYRKEISRRTFDNAITWTYFFLICFLSLLFFYSNFSLWIAYVTIRCRFTNAKKRRKFILMHSITNNTPPHSINRLSFYLESCVIHFSRVCKMNVRLLNINRQNEKTKKQQKKKNCCPNAKCSPDSINSIEKNEKCIGWFALRFTHLHTFCLDSIHIANAIAIK